MSGIERLALTAALVIAYGLFCLWCASRHRSKDTEGNTNTSDTLVAYASQTGTAIELAYQTVQALDGPVRLLSLNEVDDRVLSSTRRALIIASTYGQGEAPDNGSRFARRYLRGRGPDLAHLEFAVLALGDSRYPDFCQFGRGIHHGLSGRGARALDEPIEWDANQVGGDDVVTGRWHRQLERLGGAAHAQFLGTSRDSSPYSPWMLSERVRLNPDSPGEPLFHLKFVAPRGERRRWEAGDLIEVVPKAGRRQVPQVTDTVGLEPVAARKYSIASISSDGTLDLVVRQQRNERGQLGLASGWLTEHARVGDFIEFRVCANPLFRSPEAETPLILIGNGSGIAGLRAHLRRRQANGGGRNWLLFGERDPNADRVFSQELDDWVQGGHLERLDLTFSRCPEHPMYVQNALYTQKSLVRQWVDAGAVLMVCGSREGMGLGVDHTLEAILGRPALDRLEAANRYRRDIY